MTRSPADDIRQRFDEAFGLDVLDKFAPVIEALEPGEPNSMAMALKTLLREELDRGALISGEPPQLTSCDGNTMS